MPANQIKFDPDQTGLTLKKLTAKRTSASENPIDPASAKNLWIFLSHCTETIN